TAHRTDAVRSPPARTWCRGSCTRATADRGLTASAQPEEGTPRSPSEHTGQNFFLRLRVAVLVLVQVGLPCLAVPDLQPVDRTDDDTVLGQSRIISQFRSNHDPSLPVRRLFVGPGE